MIAKRGLFPSSLHHTCSRLVILRKQKQQQVALLFCRCSSSVSGVSMPPKHSHNKKRSFPGNKRKKKKSKSDDSDKNSRRKDSTGGWAMDDPRSQPPHAGSYAHADHAKEFGHTTSDYPTEKQAHINTTKRKVALLLGYTGTAYGGFQMNSGQRTIQSEIERALHQAGYMDDRNFGRPPKYAWSTAGRTDKGVHAAAQVCSVKIEVPIRTAVDGGGEKGADEPGKQPKEPTKQERNDAEDENDVIMTTTAREKLNQLLPADIRVLDVVRTTRGFCAHTQRDRVRYRYLLPSFCLCDDFVTIATEVAQHDPSAADAMAQSPRFTDKQMKALQQRLQSYRAPPEKLTLLTQALQSYEGTHPFHNFTKKVKSTEDRANRYISSFETEPSFIADDVEWIPTCVTGQSFLLHQIRKMVGMAMDVARGTVSFAKMQAALTRDVTTNIAPAPAQGLFMDMSYYEGYNRRKSVNARLQNLDWTEHGSSAAAHERWKRFRDEVITPHVLAEEHAEGNFVQYLYDQHFLFVPSQKGNGENDSMVTTQS